MRTPNERYTPIRDYALRNSRAMPDSSDWWVVRALIPDSWFRKKGPGVSASARAVWQKFSMQQQATAVGLGFSLRVGRGEH